MMHSERFILFCRICLPNPFTIAILLSILTAGMAVALSTSPSVPIFAHIVQVGQYWEQGFWDLLSFTMQMMLILVLGHALALAPIVDRCIHLITRNLKHSAQAAFTIALTSMVFGLLNWGLGLIVGAILARKVGEFANKNNIPINYPLMGAAGYLGLLIWHGGLSGSAPLKVAEQSHFLFASMGQVSVNQTLFSTLNLTVNATLLILVPLLFYIMGKYLPSSSTNKLFIEEPVSGTPPQAEKPIGAERLDHSRLFGKFFGILILLESVYLLFFKESYFSLSALNLNLINFILLGFGLLLFRSIVDYLNALETAIKGSVGILIQFPLYAGIAGIIKYSSLIDIFSSIITQYATITTFPIFTMLSAAIVNVFVPSGGGQWVVQGPIIIEAANQLHASLATGVMAFAYGDQLTNMLQPFWALPLLGITQLKAYEILPFTLITMVLAGAIFTMGLLLFS